MAIETGLCVSYKREIFQGIHSASDQYKIALYTPEADINPFTTSYVTTGEVQGQGYRPGGVPLMGFTVGSQDTRAFLTFENDPVWFNGTFAARGALVYNASKQNRAVAAISFGETRRCVNGPFRLVLPSGAMDGLICI